MTTATIPRDICSTIHLELDWESGLPAPEGEERTWALGSLRESDAEYSLILNRWNGRWEIALNRFETTADGRDRDHIDVFRADDQPDLSALAEAFQALIDREERQTA